MCRKAICVLLMFFLLVSTSVLAYRQVGANYHNKEKLIEEMKVLCDSEKYCDYEIIGNTILGKDIYLFKLGNSKGGSVLMDGSMHGWEDSGTESMYEMMKWLVKGEDEQAKRIMSRNYVLFIPIVNVDTSRRQNMRRLNDDNITQVLFGVDINRNFCSGFGQSGSSAPTADFPNCYRGAYCGSEPETRAVIKAMETYKPEIYANWHMGGGSYWDGCGSNQTLYNDIVLLYDKYRKEYNVTYRYPISYNSNCGAGMAIADAKAKGVKVSLITETCDDSLIPNTAQDFYNTLYKDNFPIMLAMFESVERQTSTIEIPFEFSNITAKQKAISTIILTSIFMLIILYFASKIKKF